MSGWSQNGGRNRFGSGSGMIGGGMSAGYGAMMGGLNMGIGGFMNGPQAMAFKPVDPMIERTNPIWDSTTQVRVLINNSQLESVQGRRSANQADRMYVPGNDTN